MKHQSDRRRVVAGAAGLVLTAGPARAAAHVGVVSPRPKLSLFLTRAAAADRNAFVAGWLAADAPRLARTPGLRSLVFNAVDAARTPDTPYDGVAELEFANTRTLDAALDSGTLAAGSAVTLPRPMQIVTATVVIRPLDGAATAGAKRIGLVSRPAGHDRQRFYDDWRDEHGPDVARQIGLSGYMLNLVDVARSKGSRWDGYAELWWPDWPTFEASMRKREAVREASAESFFADHLLLLVTERLRIFLPG